MSLPERVKDVEVGPRDGLQNEAVAVSIADRIAFSSALIEAGLPVVESYANFFVHPPRPARLAPTHASSWEP